MDGQIYVGLEDEAEKIINQLIMGESSLKLDIVSITGMPGSGKTTLAKKVYKDPSLKSHFHVLAWCCVSQQYQKRELLLDILRDTAPLSSSSLSEFEKWNDDDLGGLLRKSLLGKRYLVVLDDIWHIKPWNEVKYYFPDNNNRSRILFTSRMQSVALHVKPDSKPHHLRLLRDSESFELLQRMLFPNEDYRPDEKLNTLNKIAKNCRGLPLVVLTCCGILATMEKERWEDFARTSSNAPSLLTNSSTRVLELSYEALPDHLKSCLLYFGSFLPDQEILVSRLLWRWIAEGFVQHPLNNGDENKRLEDLAMEYLMDLIDSSLVMVTKKGSGRRIKEVRLHELVHQFCVTRAKEKYFLNLQNNLEQEPDQSLEPTRLCIYSLENLLPHSIRNLTSLIFFGSGYGRFSILSEFFNADLLKVLDLRGFTCTTFPSEVETLVQLRYLALFGQIASVPSTIVKLENLETFLLKGLLAEISLPFTLLKLRKLKHVQVDNHVDFTIPERSLDRECPESSHMETLSTLLLSSGQDLEDIIKKIPLIRKLKCTFLRSKDFRESYQIPALDFLSQLESLNIRSIAKVGYNLVFKFPSNLKKLTLSNFHLPWENLTRLIATLQNLEVLKLLNKACEGESWDMELEEFPKLKFLKLENLDLVHWNASGENFPCLQWLVLNKLEKLEHISIDSFEICLHSIELKSCHVSVANWAMAMERETGVKVMY